MVATKTTDVDEDYLMGQCERFLDIMSSNDTQEERNALFRAILMTVRGRIKYDLETRGITPYPCLLQKEHPGPFVLEGQLEVSPNLWSYQMANYVKSVLEVLKRKSNSFALGDGFR